MTSRYTDGEHVKKGGKQNRHKRRQYEARLGDDWIATTRTHPWRPAPNENDRVAAGRKYRKEVIPVIPTNKPAKTFGKGADPQDRQMTNQHADGVKIEKVGKQNRLKRRQYETRLAETQVAPTMVHPYLRFPYLRGDHPNAGERIKAARRYRKLQQAAPAKIIGKGGNPLNRQRKKDLEEERGLSSNLRRLYGGDSYAVLRRFGRAERTENRPASAADKIVNFNDIHNRVLGRQDRTQRTVGHQVAGLGSSKSAATAQAKAQKSMSAFDRLIEKALG